MTHPDSSNAPPSKARIDVWVHPLASGSESGDCPPSRAEATRSVLDGAFRHYFGADAPRYPDDVLPSGHGRFILAEREGSLWSTTTTTDCSVLAAFSGSPGLGLHSAYLTRPVCWQTLALRFLSPPELSDLLSMPPKRSRRRFLQLWSLKCACARAGADPQPNQTDGLQLSINRAGCILVKMIDAPTSFNRPDFARDWSLAQFELPGGLLVSGCIRLPAVVANTFSFFGLDAKGQARTLRPTVYRRSQPRHATSKGLRQDA